MIEKFGERDLSTHNIILAEVKHLLEVLEEELVSSKHFVYQWRQTHFAISQSCCVVSDCLCECLVYHFPPIQSH